jgi:hypothetical protein
MAAPNHNNHFNMLSVAQKPRYTAPVRDPIGSVHEPPNPTPSPADVEGLVDISTRQKDTVKVSMQEDTVSHSPEEGASPKHPRDNDEDTTPPPKRPRDDDDSFIMQDWYKELHQACRNKDGVNLFEILTSSFEKLNELGKAHGLRDPNDIDAETYTGGYTNGHLLQFLFSSGTVMLNDESMPGEAVKQRLKGAKLSIGQKQASEPCPVALTPKEYELLQMLKWFDMVALLRAAQNMQESDDPCVLRVLRAMLAGIHADPMEVTGDKTHGCNKHLITCVKSFVKGKAPALPLAEEGEASFYAKIIVVLMHALKQSSPAIGAQIEGLTAELEKNGHRGPPWAYLVVMEKDMARLPYVIMLAAAEHWGDFQKLAGVECASQKVKTDAIKAAAKAAKAAEKEAEDVAKAAKKAAKAAAKEKEAKMKKQLFASDHEQHQQVVAEGLSESAAVLFTAGSAFVPTMEMAAIELLMANPEEGGKHLMEGVRYQVNTLMARAPLALAVAGIENEDGITWERAATPDLNGTPVVSVKNVDGTSTSAAEVLEED